jgi:predicted DNA-binding WGR domain protein
MKKEKAKARSESVSLEFNDIAQGGKSDKVYHLSLEASGNGFTVTAQYGRRGSALATDIKTKNAPLAYAEAKQIFDRVLREKINKGYGVTEGAKAPSRPFPSILQSAEDERRGSGGQPPFETKRQELLEEITYDAVLEHCIRADDYWMQDKSDGHSRGAVKDANGSIYGLNKLGKMVPLPAEIVAELERINLESFQIDAEIVGDKLVCRDLLVADRDISSLPYVDRFCLLVRKLGSGFKFVSVVETWEGEGNKRAALKQSREQRREGVVFKQKSSPHRPGRTGSHKKFKFVKTCSVIAGEPRATGKDSVEIFLLDGRDGAIRVGTVSLIGKPAIKVGDILEVRYLYAFPSKMLCQARLERLRVDIEKSECTTAQLIYKREEAA